MKLKFIVHLDNRPDKKLNRIGCAHVSVARYKKKTPIQNRSPFADEMPSIHSNRKQRCQPCLIFVYINNKIMFYAFSSFHYLRFLFNFIVISDRFHSSIYDVSLAHWVRLPVDVVVCSSLYYRKYKWIIIWISKAIQDEYDPFTESTLAWLHSRKLNIMFVYAKWMGDMAWQWTWAIWCRGHPSKEPATQIDLSQRNVTNVHKVYPEDAVGNHWNDSDKKKHTPK